MILVNIHRLSQTIPLQSGKKSGKAAYFFMLTLHYEVVFKETHLREGGLGGAEKKVNQFPEPHLNVRSQELTSWDNFVLSAAL